LIESESALIASSISPILRAGQRFVGVIDRLYRIDGKVYIGEIKTKGYSFNTRLTTVVKKDLQTKIYALAAMLSGLDIAGIVYTVVKKPPQGMMQPMGEDKEVNASIRKDIIDYYKEPKVKTHFVREIIELDLDRESLLADLEERLRTMNDFYEDVEKSLAEAPILTAGRYPCSFCEYSKICHSGQGVDASFRYKRKRDF